MYKEKFGEDRVAAMLPRMMETGKSHGISFSYGGNTGNTYDSHRLISLAAKQGKQDAVVEELFRNYFEEEKCISDHSVLVAAAKKVGLTGAEEMLAGEAETAEVDRELQAYQEGMGITGVPFFIVDGGKYSESGAIDAGQFCQIFQRVLASK
eukprot:gnl/TRDRNA2_/TRDRNA2_144519_c0_seq1.p1 gnl/TRDRNA2_/TRDRNA2_144519_c0~~gnl/TRDRNA2_/TRDRNA2_144519_c0_seq1.p1  ORF type:complete len:152 (+),score=37.39 gnl/TRDRNA2_/TRDRNA2_144519_c0_seq1:431-886(+)